MKETDIQFMKGYEAGAKLASNTLLGLLKNNTINELYHFLKVSGEASPALSNCIRRFQNTIMQCQGSDKCGIFDTVVTADTAKTVKVAAMYVDDDAFYLVHEGSDRSDAVYASVKNIAFRDCSKGWEYDSIVFNNADNTACHNIHLEDNRFANESEPGDDCTESPSEVNN